MNTGPIRRASHIRPHYRGHRGKRPQWNRIRTADLPAIAAAFGISVPELVATAKRARP